MKRFLFSLCCAALVGGGVACECECSAEQKVSSPLFSFLAAKQKAKASLPFLDIKIDKTDGYFYYLLNGNKRKFGLRVDPGGYPHICIGGQIGQHTGGKGTLRTLHGDGGNISNTSAFSKQLVRVVNRFNRDYCNAHGIFPVEGFHLCPNQLYHILFTAANDYADAIGKARFVLEPLRHVFYSKKLKGYDVVSVLDNVDRKDFMYPEAGAVAKKIDEFFFKGDEFKNYWGEYFGSDSNFAKHFVSKEMLEPTEAKLSGINQLYQEKVREVDRYLIYFGEKMRALHRKADEVLKDKDVGRGRKTDSSKLGSKTRLAVYGDFEDSFDELTDKLDHLGREVLKLQGNLSVEKSRSKDAQERLASLSREKQKLEDQVKFYSRIFKWGAIGVATCSALAISSFKCIKNWFTESQKGKSRVVIKTTLEQTFKR